MTKEILQKLRVAKSPEELMEIAKANGEELTAEQAKVAYDRLCGSGELSDDDLEGGMLYTPYNLRKRFRLTHKKI